MKIFLFGATGRTGKEVLDQLLQQGYDVTVLVRSIIKLDYLKNSKLSIIEGDIFNPDSYKKELSKSDVVISTIGTGSSKKPTTIYSEGTGKIISVMKNAGIKKIIMVTAAAFDTTDPGANNFMVKYIARPLFKNIYSDMITLESMLENEKDINWICIRPPRLTNGKLTRKYRVKINHCPEGGWRISRKDLADFIVKQINSDEYTHKKPVISY